MIGAVVATAISAVIFKFAAEQNEASRWLVFFGLGLVVAFFVPLCQVIGIRGVNPNLFHAIFAGGAVIGTQLSLLLVFRQKMAPIQWFGLCLILFGVVLMHAKLAHSETNNDVEPEISQEMEKDQEQKESENKASEQAA